MPKISVIVPIYNVERYIEKCIHSLFSQTFDEVEYIFVNDCTPDKSIEIIKEVLELYPNRRNSVKIINHEVNKGLPAARATGLKHAEGDFVIHSDSDDWMEPVLLEKMYNTAISQNSDCVYCDFYFVKKTGVERYFAPKTTDNKIKIINNWVNTKWTVIWNILAKRTIYNEYNVKFPVGIRYCEDFYVGIQLLCYSNKIVHIAEALHNYNMLNQSSILHTDAKDIMNSDAAKVYEEVLDILVEKKMFDLYGESVSWRFLDGMQYCVLEKQYFRKFKTLHPETHRHILSCPFLNIKVKMMMWCLDKNWDFIVKIFIGLRNILRRR